MILTEVYPAGEPKIKGADSQSLMEAIQKNMQLSKLHLLQDNQLFYESDIKKLPSTIIQHVQDGDVVITMGAGSISAIPGKLVEGSHE